LRAQEAKYKASLGHDWLAYQQEGYPDTKPMATTSINQSK
jgi:hypothetical protein